jgi:uncharacterized lipoprotein YehR (DUF1307 family)
MKQIFNLKGVKMKKGLFLLASVVMLMLAGCGESGGVTSASGNTNSVAVDNGEVSKTTITNEFGLNPDLGTPPPLPAS